jgi:uncharacterized membrane protein SpoIIM required for sporulation
MKELNLGYTSLKNILQDNKLPILVSTTVYLFGFMLAIFLSYTYSSTMNSFGISLISGTELTMQSSPTFEYIFISNIKTILILFSGSFLFGFTTFMNLICNGLFFGGIFAESLKQVSLTKALLLTVPHAIIELPALFIAGAAGFKIPYELLLYLNGKKDYILKKKEIIDFLTLVCLSIFLIFIAAVVESHVTVTFLGI